MLMRVLSFCFLLILSGCSALKWGPAQPLVVMTYNVENLFDTTHDQNKQDWTFLPKEHEVKRSGCLQVTSSYWQKQCFETDWTEDKLEVKLAQIERVIKASSETLPHFLGLTEVENENVLRRLADRLGYEHWVISDGPDERGIDVALLYRTNPDLRFVNSREHQVEWTGRPTRPILEVEMSYRGTPLLIYVNHWPSQGGPNEYRLAAAELLATQVQKRSEAMVIAMGDFNVIEENQPHALRDVLEKKTALIDLHTKASETRELPPGTYFFAPKMAWNLLDRLYVSPNLLTGPPLQVDLESYEIVREDFMTKTVKGVPGVPKRYEFDQTKAQGAGFSDHFPVVVRLKVVGSDSR